MKRSEDRLEFEALREFISLIDCGGNLGNRVRKVVDEELTVRQRQMMEMYYYQRLSMPEIALELGVSPSSVSRTIMRGRGKIRKYLKYNGRAFAQSFSD